MKIEVNKKIIILILIILLLISIDQLVKTYVISNLYDSSVVVINDVLNLTYVENTGGAFGIGNNILILIIVNIIIIYLLLRFILLRINQASNYTLISIALIIAGGIGNLIDRIFRGHVIDYIDISPLFKYPVFNFSDICVVLGVFFIIMYLISNKDKL